MLVIKLLSLIVLAVILFQDFKMREVYWIAFPVLSALLLFIRLYHSDSPELWFETIGFNVIQISFQLLLVTAYFSLKKKRVVNLANGLLNWGDIVFLLSITVYFSVFNYLFFYITSLAIALVLWVSVKGVARLKTVKIPLAGIQAMILLLFLLAEWGPHWVRLDNDAWVLNMINR